MLASLLDYTRVLRDCLVGIPATSTIPDTRGRFAPLPRRIAQPPPIGARNCAGLETSHPISRCSLPLDCAIAMTAPDILHSCSLASEHRSECIAGRNADRTLGRANFFASRTNFIGARKHSSRSRYRRAASAWHIAPTPTSIRSRFSTGVIGTSGATCVTSSTNTKNTAQANKGRAFAWRFFRVERTERDYRTHFAPDTGRRLLVVEIHC